MRYESLGRTGLKVSSPCLGCMNFGGPTDEELSQIDKIVPPGKAVVSFYEADFGPNEFS